MALRSVASSALLAAIAALVAGCSSGDAQTVSTKTVKAGPEQQAVAIPLGNEQNLTGELVIGALGDHGFDVTSTKVKIAKLGQVDSIANFTKDDLDVATGEVVGAAHDVGRLSCLLKAPGGTEFSVRKSTIDPSTKIYFVGERLVCFYLPQDLHGQPLPDMSADLDRAMQQLKTDVQ